MFLSMKASLAGHPPHQISNLP